MAHAGDLYALGWAMKILTSSHEFVNIDQTVLIAVDDHEESPDILHKNAVVHKMAIGKQGFRSQFVGEVEQKNELLGV